MKRSASQERNWRGWLAAGSAGVSLGAAGVTTVESSGGWLLAMVGAASVSLVCAFVGARMEAGQTHVVSWTTVALVGMMAALGVLVARLEGVAGMPVLVVVVTVIALLATVVAGKRRGRSKPSCSDWM
jgi:hypothetical protein